MPREKTDGVLQKIAIVGYQSEIENEVKPETIGSEPVHCYEIVVNGRLNNGWRDWFGPDFVMQIRGNRTVLTGPVIDQSSLYGIIRKIRNLGLPLISVVRLNEKENEKWKN